MEFANQSSIQLKSPVSQVAEYESTFRAFLDNSPTVAWIKDSEGRHVYLSRPYLSMIGVPIEDWFGKTDFELWPDEIAQKFVSDDQEVLKNGTVLNFEDVENVTFENGADRIWWVVKFPINDANSNRFVGGIAVDISDQKLAESEKRRLESELANIVSREQSRIGQDLHDGVGQELTALHLYALSLKEQIACSLAADVSASELASTIGPSVDRLTQGLMKSNEHVRALSHGLIPLDLDTDHLSDALAQLVAETDGLGLLSCELAQCDELVELVNPVPTHLYRVAQEAINNAVKHSHATSIVISLQQNVDETRLQVFDNGCGIGPAKSSSGMGMQIMNYRAELIGAHLSVHSEKNHGTMITCKLSRKESCRSL